MHTTQLETFICVAEAGSFNKAAEQLYITPPAVTKQMNLLEEDLGLQLFIRTHRGLLLTEAGKSFYKDAKYIIQYCKDSIERAKKSMENKDNVIRIGTSPMTPAQPLVDLLPKLQKRCPNMKIQVVPFENTPENAREILKNLGKNIDVVAGIFDDAMLHLRQCTALELSKEPICCAVSVYHRLAGKEKLSVQDLYGENFMLMRRGWSNYVDHLRDDLWRNHPQIHVIDFEFYNVDIFNQCENSNDVLMAIENWKDVHPLLKIIPVDWEHTIPFGVLYSPNPSETVCKFLDAVKAEKESRR